MDFTDKKKIILIAAVAVVIIVIVAAFIVVVQRGGGLGAAVNLHPAPTVPASLESSATHLPVPANTVVPEKGQSVSSSVAVPQIEIAAAPGVDAKYRSFSITLENGQFTPNTIAVNLGDTLHLQITAVGGNYDFIQPDLGLSTLLPEGKSKIIEASPMIPGKFIFYCSSCGGPSKGPIGYLIVKGP